MYQYNSNLSISINEENAAIAQREENRRSGGKLAAFVAFVLLPLTLLVAAYITVLPVLEKIITPYMVGF